MIEKRFTYVIDNGKDTIYDLNIKGCVLENFMDIEEMLNSLYEENEQLKDEVFDWKESAEDYLKLGKSLKKENEQLKQELHLVHMKSMFSTVQSFKGDVSKRYKYSKKTDTVYDTANHYGQYDKILDKKEIVMLLNEYETILNEKGDME